MISQPVYAGVDISKHHIDTAIAPQGDRLSIASSDLDRLVAWLVWAARVFTSLATTAKPLPISPARAA